MARGIPPKLEGRPRGVLAAPPKFVTLSCRPRVGTVMASPPSTFPSSPKSSWTKTKVSTDQGFWGKRVLGECVG